MSIYLFDRKLRLDEEELILEVFIKLLKLPKIDQFGKDLRDRLFHLTAELRANIEETKMAKIT